MFLTEVSNLSSFSPFRAGAKKRSVPDNFDLLSRSFDENVLRRLHSLSTPSISLSWLSLAVDFLSSTHAEAQTLISNLRSSGSGSSDDPLALYMDHSVKLLDICNSISSEIEKLRQRRLLINLVLHLLDFPAEGGQMPVSEKLRKARDSLANWENKSGGSVIRRGFQVVDPEVLIGDLVTALGSAPRGKISSAGKLIRRTFYAVGLATVFVAGVLASCVYGLINIGEVRAPAEFLWADKFNDLQSSIFDETKKRRRSSEGGERKERGWLAEMDDVAARVVGVRDVVDDVVSGDSNDKVRLESAVKELETATAELSKGLESLANGVNGLFNTVLSTRNSVMGAYIVGPEKQRK